MNSRYTFRLWIILVFASIPDTWSLSLPNQKRYFAIGSNMEPATMTSLRNIEPLASSAAILPGYELAFDIPGNPLIEPSAASVRRAPTNEVVVHGVLYELTEKDFGRLGSSEGVPFVYRWESCRVIPYVGDGREAGKEALLEAKENADACQLDAYVLSASPLLWRRRRGPSSDIPPSKSYLKILQDGAAYWKLDRDYQNKLARVSVSKVAPGVSDLLLQTAKRFNPK